MTKEERKRNNGKVINEGAERLAQIFIKQIEYEADKKNKNGKAKR